MPRPKAEALSSGSRDRSGARSTRSSEPVRNTESGRAAGLSAGLIVAFLLLGYAALRTFESAPRSSPAARKDAPVQTTPARSYRAEVTLGEARVLARLLPLHGEPALEEFRAHALRARYALPDGEPWRLYLSLAEPCPTAVLVSAARVGTALAPFAELARESGGIDPLRALLAAPPGALEVERARPLVLWGRFPADAPVLELASAEHTGSGALVPEEAPAAPRWYAGTGTAPADEPELEDEVARLTRELERERTKRAEREQAFLEFSRLLAQLPAGKELGLEPPRPSEPEPLSPEEEERLAAERAACARALEIGRSLAVLMRLEGLRGLDLLEAGTLHAGPPSAIGPVVFRCLDERGRLSGSVRAERLRLEASQAAHTLTLVLEQGHESRGGEPVPFEGGVRRITLRDVDPEPWIAECPELFESPSPGRTSDDGAWSLSEVRRELNRLLALDTDLGWYRLHSLGGVRGSELVDVQLEELEQSGRLARRLFADRMSLLLEDGSVVLELRDGAFVRGREKQPFRDGLHRIVLPGADAAVWRVATLPGFAAPPSREKAAEEPGSGR